MVNLTRAGNTTRKWKRVKELSEAAADQGTVICLGYFDGVHLGHQALLKVGRDAADRLGLPLLVHTFDRAPGKSDASLTDLEQRKRLLLRYGADGVAVSPFDDDLRKTSGEAFIRGIIIGKLHARVIVCGDDHRFGYLGKCGVEELRSLCAEYGAELVVVPAVTLDGIRVSSTAIREALASGDTELAEKMLGRGLTDSFSHPEAHTV